MTAFPMPLPSDVPAAPTVDPKRPTLPREGRLTLSPMLNDNGKLMRRQLKAELRAEG